MRVNGQERPWRAEWLLEQLLAEMHALEQGVAVERNGQIVRRHDWPHCVIEPNDVIEVVRLVGGG